MIKNDGSKTNEQIFWGSFFGIYKEKAQVAVDELEKFYRNTFIEAKVACGYNKMAKNIIEMLKEKGVGAVLATNPVFPKIATYARASWAGLDTDDFMYITTYENSRHCKPNIEYYKDILNELSLNPEECLMVGNDVRDDMIAERLGMKVFLLTDCLINSENADISVYPQGNFSKLKEYIDKLC
ncbi:MAG: HAD hydrolase-like protein [Clostridia bacterium]|nr:HAD hydrolase-like protein [Clostridia bacterium]